jgi:mono/diheme cytochrome c family protein
MKVFRILPVAVLAFAAAPSAFAQGTGGADASLIDQGHYLAKAGDCAACHGENLAGGKAIATPVGKIVASNITPDDTTGIGRWTLGQFSDAMRKGKSPEGHLYPAMPYTSYTGLSDEQVRALYSYLKLAVKPVSHKVAETELPFPFLRPVMAVWDALFLDKGHPVGAVAANGDKAERGRFLVETMGHCGACHTPRGTMMQQVAAKHLGGAMVDGWWAPNLTPGKGGLSRWSDAELETFLATGHTAHAVAAGEMGTVVSRSLSKLKPNDISAIVAYLRTVPPVDSTVPAAAATGQASSAKAQSSEVQPAHVQLAQVEMAAVASAGTADGPAMLSHNTQDGAVLYQSACASCHGMNGNGSPGALRPSLREIDAVTGPNAANLVQVIAHGVDREVGEHEKVMPGFAGTMDAAQIAALANYVRTTFGGVPSQLTAQDVTKIRNGEVNRSWLISNARWLAIAGIAAACLLLAAVSGWVLLHSGRRAASSNS